MAKIHCLVGDATLPRAAGHKLIAHVCNDAGGWGKGFVLSVSRRWKGPEQAYRRWFGGRGCNDFRLGSVQVVQVGSYIHVANMVAQEGLGGRPVGRALRHDALSECLNKLSLVARDLGASVHMPRIGVGLGGGDWELVEPLIENTLVRAGLQVYVYDWEAPRSELLTSGNKQGAL